MAVTRDMLVVQKVGLHFYNQEGKVIRTLSVIPSQQRLQCRP